MGFPIYVQGAHSTYTFPAIVVESHGRTSISDEVVVQNVEHLEKRCIRRYSLYTIILEMTPGMRILLTPNFQIEIHLYHSSL
jgi:hypothetical protein